MSVENNSVSKPVESKKRVLPFLIRRAPLENNLSYEKKGHWTQKEKLKYVIFLSYFKDKFTSKDKKKRFCRIFKVMSDFIKTRTHNQCRSHHQKMEKERFEVDSVIKNLVSKYHPRVYQELYDRYLIEIENLNLDGLKEYKIRNINQNLPKFSSEQNFENSKNPSHGHIKQRLRAKRLSKKEKLSDRISKSQVEDQAPVFMQKPNWNKKQLRMTEECEEDEREFEVVSKECQNEFLPKNQCCSQKQKSLDFVQNNNLMGLDFNQEKKVPLSFPEYIQNLELRKIEHYNKANYHYNQMQIELANVAECEKEKTKVIEEQQKSMMINQFGMGYGFSNFMWGFQDYNKTF